MRRLTSRFLFLAVLGLGLSAGPVAAEAKTVKKTAKAKPKKAPPVKKPPPLSADAKKKLQAQLLGEFKFGMSKDEVISLLAKDIEKSYEERIQATTDITTQDRLRAERKKDIARIKGTYVAFDGKRTGWDVSIIEDEFAHKTGESMLETWKKEGALNNRRFFFFKDGRLWKVFVSLDVSILPEESRNFETFRNTMEKQFGGGLVENGTITWRAAEFNARAVDKLKTYDALGLAIEDAQVSKELVAEREAKAPPKKETSAVIKAVIDPEDDDRPDVKANSGAIDAVIKAQGGK